MEKERFTSFREAYDYFYGQKNHFWDMGLENIKSFLRSLGSPEEKLGIVQIAGTNGKGSVSAYLSQILMGGFKRVGCYNSPVVFEEGENIAINNEPMGEVAFTHMVNKLYKPMEEAASEKRLPTVFELETALAIEYFYEQGCDIVILEAGLGGREDATNVSSCNLLSVFTSVSLDHMNYLGDTLYKIACVKAGIIKSGYGGGPARAVIGVNKAEALKAVEDAAKSHGAVLSRVDAKDISIISVENKPALEKIASQSFTYKGRAYTTKMLGKYQTENAALAIEAARLLGSSEESIAHGIKCAFIKGRFQVVAVKSGIATVIDGAHNTGAAERLRENIEEYLKDFNIVAIMGVFADKDYEGIIDILLDYLTCTIAVPACGKRALAAENLKAAIEARSEAKAKAEAQVRAGSKIKAETEKETEAEFKITSNIYARTDYAEAYKLAFREALRLREENGRPSVILAFGSLSYIRYIYSLAADGSIA